MMRKYSTIVGIDVSKRTLDVCLKTGNEYSFCKLENNESGFIELLELIGDLESLLVCMEHTGIYSFPLCNSLGKAGVSYTLIAALEIKRSLGIQRGKSDKSDSRSIARYGYLFQGELILQTLPEVRIHLQ